MLNIVLLTTAWGRKFGGINAFNEDLASALADVLQGSGQVFCAVLSPDSSQEAAAAKRGVTLIPILDKAPTDQFDTSWAHDIGLWLKAHRPGTTIDWWVGHDVVSGACALKAAELFPGRPALIHHMSYARYQSFKTADPTDTDRKQARQAKLFAASAEVFAVGPLLARSAEELASRPVTMLIPGFPESAGNATSSVHSLKAIAFGRLDAGSDPIKLGSLAAAAFGKAVKRAHETLGKWRTLEEGELVLLGAGTQAGREADDPRAIARSHAGRNVLVRPLPYDEDPVAVQARLASSNLAMMLSIHEGFGLVGWESIAAETPLILTKRSGLYELLASYGGPVLGCFLAVDIKGDVGESNFSADDVTEVSDAILLIAGDLERARQNAFELKNLLQQRLSPSWRTTAETLLNGLRSSDIAGSGEESKGGQKEQFRARSLEVRPDTAGKHLAAVVVLAPLNRVPDCAELQIGTTQGSCPEDFDLLPELRFGRQTFSVDGLRVSYGLRSATVTLDMENCQIRPGRRLGDDEKTAPHVAATGGGKWRISGPREGEILFRKALGDEPLCGIQASESAGAKVTISVSCAPQDLAYEFDADDADEKAVTTTRMIEAFLTRCLRDEDTEDLNLCHAVVRPGGVK